MSLRPASCAPHPPDIAQRTRILATSAGRWWMTVHSVMECGVGGRGNREGPTHLKTQVGNLIAGAVAERFGAPVALAGGGILTLVILASVTLLYAPLRSLRAETIAAAGRGS